MIRRSLADIAPDPAHATELLIENAGFLARTGSSLTDAARRLGYPTPDALVRQLHRLGQHQLATNLGRNGS